MESIIVGFSRPKKFMPFAWLIMKAYRIPYSHVYIKLNAKKYDRDLIYQASKSMVNFMSMEVFDSHNKIYCEFKLDITSEDYIKLLQFCIDNAGRPYSLKEVLGFAIQKISSWFGKKIENPIKMNKSEWVCSVIGSLS